MENLPFNPEWERIAAIAAIKLETILLKLQKEWLDASTGY